MNTQQNPTQQNPTQQATPQPQAITYVVASNSFPKPPVYQGERDGFLCEAWLTAMRRYFLGADIPDAKRTLTAVSYMAAAAALWWEGQALDDLCPWDEFAAAFRSEFCPAGFLDQVRSMLFTIKMTSTVSDYVARTRKYLALLGSGDMHEQARAMLEESAKSCFVNGAPLALKQQLLNFEINNPAYVSIHAMCNAAERFDGIFHYRPDQSPSAPAHHAHNQNHQNHNPQPNLLATPHHDPMAMDLDNLVLAVNALARRFNSNNGNNGNNNSWSPNYGNRLPPLTQQERERLRAQGGCFKCRKPGHIARECGKRFNNFQVNEGHVFDSASGNASSGQV